MSNHTVKAFAGGLALLFLAASISAYAQMPPGMQEVSGKYTNTGAGVEVTFPSGWSGFEMSGSFGTLVTTSLGGMSESDPETMKTIALVISEKSENQDPRDPSTFSNDVDNCDDPSIKSRTTAGVQGIEVTAECPETSQTYRIVAVETGTNWIVIMYMAPTADFESEVRSFDSAVASLKVEGAVNTEASSGGGNSSNGSGGNDDTNLGLELKSVIQSVLVKGKNMDLAVKTTSTISNFKVEEQNKRLSFTVDGQTGTQGSTEIPVGKVLEGPYTVTIDGKSTTYFEVVNDGSADAVMMISYMHSTHDITVSGTNVVPEFPVAMIGVIAALIGVVTLVGRTRLFQNKI
jgi:hypothetical protein